MEMAAKGHCVFARRAERKKKEVGNGEKKRAERTNGTFTETRIIPVILLCTLGTHKRRGGEGAQAEPEN